MTITKEQRQQLYTYLDKIFIYHETLTEVYDHVLTAIEQYQGNLPFDEAVTEIIKRDFGGAKRLPQLEKEFKESASEKVGRLFVRAFARNLLYAALPLLIINGVLVFEYHFAMFCKPVIYVIISVFFLITTADYFYRPYRRGYISGTKKKFMKDVLLSKLLNTPYHTTCLTAGLFGFGVNKVSTSAVAVWGISSLFYILLPVFIWSYFKAFRKDYRLIPNLN